MTRTWRVWPVGVLLSSEAVLFGVDAILWEQPSLTAVILLLIAIVDAIALVQWVRVVKVHGSMVPPPPWTIPTIVVGQASGSVYFLIPLWIEARSGVHDLQDLGICAGALVGLLIAVFVLGRAVASQPAGALKSSRAVLLAVLPLASSVQFWYSSIYRPAHQRPDISITASLEGVGPKHGVVTQVLATVTLENEGSTDVDVLGSIYTVTGFSMSPASTGMTLADVDDEGLRTPYSADQANDYRGVVRIGRLMSAGGHLAAGQKVVMSAVLAVDRRSFSKLRLSVSLSSVVELDQSVKHRSDGAGHCDTFDLPSASGVRRALGDRPTARTCITYSTLAPPDVETRFGYADQVGSAMSDSAMGVSGGDPNTRGFKTSIEYSLADS